MKQYEIGKYILDLKSKFIYYVDGSVSERKYGDYAEALEAARMERDDDVKSGREAELLKDDKVFLYFTAKWEEETVQMFFHASWALDKDVMQKIHDYDDRIVFI